MSGQSFFFLEGNDQESLLGLFPSDSSLHLNLEIWVPGSENQPRRPEFHRELGRSLSTFLSRMFNTENNVLLIQRRPQPTVDKEKKAKEIMKKIVSVKATEGECSICQCPFKKNSKVPSLTCKHQFHKKCLTNWIKIRETCPMCRGDIKNSTEQ